MAESKRRIIEVVPHNPEWNADFLKAREEITQVLCDEVICINHIGSTAIPGIYAKPIIDVLIGVKSIGKVDSYNDKMSEIGYYAKGEYGIAGRRYFVKGEPKRTHHVHIFQIDDPQIDRHINFRDYMIAHPEEAKKYEELKKGLAEEHKYDANHYVNGKNSFIQSIDRKAQLWRNGDQESALGAETRV